MWAIGYEMIAILIILWIFKVLISSLKSKEQRLVERKKKNRSRRISF
jgi:hypothetical protein